MRSVEFLNVEIDGAGALGKIPFDPFLAAVASLKTVDGKALVSHWINPESAMSIVEDDRFKLRDAANATVYVSQATSNPLPAHTAAINGQATLSIDQPISILDIGDSGGGSGVNADEWTLIAVCNLDATGTNQRVFGLGGGALDTGSLWPVLEVASTGSLSVREGGTTTRRVISTAEGLVGVPVILCATFSTQLGMAAFKNDLQGFVRNADDKRPLTVPNFSFMGDRGGVSNYALGDFGMAFALRGDISKPEYSAAREVLLGGLMDRYGIS